MTAIAWDGETLATDTMYDQAGMRGYVRKLVILKHPVVGKMIVGLSGHCRGSSVMVLQLEAGRIGKVADYEEEMVYGIGIDSQRRVFEIFGNGYLLDQHVSNVHVASGSAWQYLLGAMQAGLTSQQAVELAIANRCDAGISCETLVWSEVFEGQKDEGPLGNIPF